MQMQKLFENIIYTGVLPQGEAVLVTQDSRRVCEGAVFVCAKGGKSDGHDFAEKAIAAGALAIVTERRLGVKNEIVVENTRKAYAALCQNFFDNPARKLRLVAVTGTNGKTTVTTLIKEIVEKSGYKAGLIGTIHTEIDTVEIPAKYTTPEPWDLAALMSRMHAAGCTFAILEASSQALDQLRLWGLQFEVGVFTNLTQDHLDYHKTFENYYMAKKSMFNQVNTMIVNIDDEYGRRLLDECKADKTITFSNKDNTADYTARNIKLSASGVSFVMVGTSFIERISFPMPGEYSVHNALAAAAAAIALGIPSDKVSTALIDSHGVRGRCEVLYHGKFTVLCDYAHTGDAIEKVLSGIAPFADNRLLVLFGCAGERDAQKRPLMASAVMEYADFIILTSDNPRKENPYDIMNEVIPLLKEGGKPYIAEVERRCALNKALDMLKDGDVLVLCGKGHEDYQVIDGVTLYLDEHRIVKEWLGANGYIAT
ncbi:MAG: UDP-N-acetylmuramoyl-L-alanyl-D-glutamate--2,6-diaminopimelate ligase [Oscillospiraceae bacterium]